MLHSALQVLFSLSAGTESADGAVKTATDVANGVTKIVFTALERNVLIGVIALAIMGTISFAYLWVRERTALSVRVHQAIEKAADQRSADRKEVIAELEVLREKMDALFKDTVDEFKEMREKDQDRNDKKEDLLRDFALNMAQTMNEMKDHFTEVTNA